MKFLYDDKNIIACSSGTTSNSALAVIRISGSFTPSDFNSFFSIDLNQLKPKQVYLCDLLDGHEVVDNIVLTFFKGPNSYNGENILELSVHGNLLNVQRVIDLFITAGICRHAGAGEFTYRALQNKKLTLSQVEGLDLLLNANSSLMLNQGLGALQGELHQSYQALHDKFLRLKASVELSIDFLEDIGDEAADENFNSAFDDFFNHIGSLYSRTRGNLSELTSPSMVLIGQTNAGKSSLFNTLLKNNRSIVSNIAGTTRDYVTEYICINGTNYRLVDTAGIRESEDTIENIGIERTLELNRSGFFRILVVNPFETNVKDFVDVSDNQFDLLVVTNADREGWEDKFSSLRSSLPQVDDVKFVSLISDYIGSIEPVSHIGPMGPETKSGSMGPVVESGPMGPDLESGSIGPHYKMKPGSIGPSIMISSELSSYIENKISDKYNKITLDSPILIDRHRDSLRTIYSKTQEFQSLKGDICDAAIISSELNLIGNEISELIGIITIDDILTSIFSNFCIGK